MPNSIQGCTGFLNRRHSIEKWVMPNAIRVMLIGEGEGELILINKKAVLNV